MIRNSVRCIFSVSESDTFSFQWIEKFISEKGSVHTRYLLQSLQEWTSIYLIPRDILQDQRILVISWELLSNCLFFTMLALQFTYKLPMYTENTIKICISSSKHNTLRITERTLYAFFWTNPSTSWNSALLHN